MERKRADNAAVTLEYMRCITAYNMPHFYDSRPQILMRGMWKWERRCRHGLALHERERQLGWGGTRFFNGSFDVGSSYMRNESEAVNTSRWDDDGVIQSELIAECPRKCYNHELWNGKKGGNVLRRSGRFLVRFRHS